MKPTKAAGRRVAVESPAGALPRPHPLLAMIVAVGVLLALAPTVARTPQSGDGAEVVRVAVQGGVLHPPGFPLQAWIDRGLVLATGMNPSLVIAGFGLACHAATVGFIVATLTALGAGVAAALGGAAAFAFFPSTWRLAVEPELFAPAHLCAALLLFLAVRGARGAAPVPPRRPGARPSAPSDPAATLAEPALAGLAGGLAAATHPVVLAALPALVVANARALRSGPQRAARIAIASAALLVPAAALYFSMLRLRTASPWPDWGSLATGSDVLRHALRLEYGGLAMSAADAPATASGLAQWFADIGRGWNLAAVLVLAGAWALRARGGTRAVIAVIGTLASGLAILARARLPEQSYTASEIERLQGPAVIAAAILLGLGIDVLRRRLPRRGRRPLDVAVAAGAIAMVATGWRGADAAHDATLALHQEGVAAEIGDAVYVTEGDLETFSGVPSHGGSRYPVMGPEIAFEWYWRNVAPRLEPRVALAGTPASWDDFLVACFARGLTVAGTSRALFSPAAPAPELRGLLYFQSAGTGTADSTAPIAAALRLVPLVERLPVLPPGRREYSRFYQRRFARAFSAAGDRLRAHGVALGAAAADSVAGALLRGLPTGERRARLDAFVRAAARTR